MGVNTNPDRDRCLRCRTPKAGIDLCDKCAILLKAENARVGWPVRRQCDNCNEGMLVGNLKSVEFRPDPDYAVWCVREDEYHGRACWCRFWTIDKDVQVCLSCNWRRQGFGWYRNEPATMVACMRPGPDWPDAPVHCDGFTCEHWERRG